MVNKWYLEGLVFHYLIIIPAIQADPFNVLCILEPEWQLLSGSATRRTCQWLYIHPTMTIYKLISIIIYFRPLCITRSWLEFSTSLASMWLYVQNEADDIHVKRSNSLKRLTNSFRPVRRSKRVGYLNIFFKLVPASSLKIIIQIDVGNDDSCVAYKWTNHPLKVSLLLERIFTQQQMTIILKSVLVWFKIGLDLSYFEFKMKYLTWIWSFIAFSLNLFND